jgi:mono/diheme cytochrome c family protein
VTPTPGGNTPTNTGATPAVIMPTGTPVSTGDTPTGTTPPTGTEPTPTPTPTPTPGPAPATGKPAPRVLVSEIELPTGVRNILERRCSACHTYGERDPIGWGSAMDLSRMIASDIVVPGDPDKSRLWNRVAVRADMPFNGSRLDGAEIAVLRAWMANLNRPTQKPRSQEELLDLVVTDQAKVRAQGNDHRYISFAHFADERRSGEELKAAAEVLSVVINSLSRRAGLVKPEPIDPGQTIFRFRLSQLGWDREDWDELMTFYPYCIRSEKQAHRAVYDRLQTEGPIIRGDWFLATATKPPLYERLLDIPQTIPELEDDLNIDIVENINRRNNRNVIRVGFQSSGVSANNRMIERHARPNGGYFWISYDFNNNEDEADLRRNPLGPAAFDEQNFDNRFVHQGGEAIWSLPNGMQAYLLADAAGNRVDTAPKDIVRDARRPPGAVENGVSCIGCHGVTGMNVPRVFDEIPKYADEHRRDFNDREFREIKALYPTNGQQIIAADAARYLKVMQAVGGTGIEPGRTEYDAFINLVGQYEGKVGLRGGAMELGLDVTAAKALSERGRNEDSLPTALADPLVTRNDFICRLRRIVPSVGTRPQFCRDTFTEDTVRALCD